MNHTVATKTMQGCIGIILCNLFFSINIFSQTPVLLKTALGGTKEDKVQTFQHTQDGGYIIAGATLSNDGDVKGFKGVSDIWLVKRRSDLSADWSICLGTKCEELGSIVRETTHGDYLVLGGTKSTRGDYDLVLSKVSKSGTFLWQKIFGGSGHEWVNNLHEYTDGSLMICATTESNDRDVSNSNGGSDIWLLKLNADGAVNWKKTYGGTGKEIVNSFEATPDGGALISASTSSSEFDGYVGNSSDAWIIKIGGNGIVDWTNLLKTSNIEQFMMVKRRPVGDYIFVLGCQGNDYDFPTTNPPNNIWVVKINSDGTVADKVQFDKGGSDNVRDLIITAANEVIVAGDYHIGQGYASSWIFKLNASLQFSNEFILSSPGGSNKPYLLRQTKDYGFIVFEQYVSNNQKDVRLTKLNANLQFVWDKTFGGPGDEELCDCGGWWAKDPWWNKMTAQFFPSNVLEDANGNYYFATQTSVNGGDVQGVHMPIKGTASDIWFVKYNPATVVSSSAQKELITEAAATSFKHSIYPNPARQSATISFTAQESAATIIEIYNIQGARVRVERIGAARKGNTYQHRLDLSDLSAGSYLYRLRNGTRVGRGTVVKID